jgi:hypothetical protein
VLSDEPGLSSMRGTGIYVHWGKDNCFPVHAIIACRGSGGSSSTQS